MAAAVLERTCALIKPDALDNASEILQLAELSGLTIIDRAELRVRFRQLFLLITTCMQGKSVLGFHTSGLIRQSLGLQCYR